MRNFIFEMQFRFCCQFPATLLFTLWKLHGLSPLLQLEFSWSYLWKFYIPFIVKRLGVCESWCEKLDHALNEDVDYNCVYHCTAISYQVRITSKTWVQHTNSVKYASILLALTAQHTNLWYGIYSQAELILNITDNVISWTFITISSILKRN